MQNEQYYLYYKYSLIIVSVFFCMKDLYFHSLGIFFNTTYCWTFSLFRLFPSLIV